MKMLRSACRFPAEKRLSYVGCGRELRRCKIVLLLPSFGDARCGTCTFDSAAGAPRGPVALPGAVGLASQPGSFPVAASGLGYVASFQQVDSAGSSSSSPENCSLRPAWCWITSRAVSTSVSARLVGLDCPKVVFGSLLVLPFGLFDELKF